MRSWEAAYKAGDCNEAQSAFWNTKAPEELYDTENDPWEVNNLADDPGYEEILERMRKANKDWMIGISDAGFIRFAESGKMAGGVVLSEVNVSDLRKFSAQIVSDKLTDTIAESKIDKLNKIIINEI